MKRSIPLKRVGFKRKPVQPQREPDECVSDFKVARAGVSYDRLKHGPVFVSVMAANIGAEPPRPVPKEGTFRSEAWRRAVASLPCARCGKEGSTQCAHVNHRGKGLALKAPDCWTFPLCGDCHREFDQGKDYSLTERRQLADEWIIWTIKELAVRGLIRA